MRICEIAAIDKHFVSFDEVGVSLGGGLYFARPGCVQFHV
jgi:hypothetical protein